MLVDREAVVAAAVAVAVVRAMPTRKTAAAAAFSTSAFCFFELSYVTQLFSQRLACFLR